jgi:hypothetical protein
MEVVTQDHPTAIPGQPRQQHGNAHLVEQVKLATVFGLVFHDDRPPLQARELGHRKAELVLAGPFNGGDDWRGMFIFATPDVGQARTFVATDPVIVQSEMVAEYHPFYGSAGLMTVNDIHNRIEKK